MEATERLSLPLLVAGQAQKEVSHNEALLLLDAIVAGTVEEAPRNDPPESPVEGTCYLVGEAPTGTWAQYSSHVAAFGSAGWRFVAPVFGLSVTVKTTGTRATFGSSGWEVGTVRASRLLVDGVQVVGPQSSRIGSPSGGTMVDAEARNTLDQILSALRSHGLIATRKIRSKTAVCGIWTHVLRLFGNSCRESPVARKPTLSYVFAQFCHGTRLERG